MNLAAFQLWRLGLHAAIDALFNVLEQGALRKPSPTPGKGGAT